MKRGISIGKAALSFCSKGIWLLAILFQWVLPVFGQTIDFSDLHGARRDDRTKQYWEVGWGRPVSNFNGKRSNNIFNYGEPAQEVLLIEQSQEYVNPGGPRVRVAPGREGLVMCVWDLENPIRAGSEEELPEHFVLEVAINAAKAAKIQFWIRDDNDISVTLPSPLDIRPEQEAYQLPLTKGLRYERDRLAAGQGKIPRQLRLVARCTENFTLKSGSLYEDPEGIYPVKDKDPLKGVLMKELKDETFEGLKGLRFNGTADVSFQGESAEFARLGPMADTAVVARAYGGYQHTLFDEAGQTARLFSEIWKRGTPNSWATFDYMFSSNLIDKNADGNWNGNIFGRLRGSGLLDYYIVLPATYFDFFGAGANRQLSFHYRSKKGEGICHAALDPEFCRADQKTRVAFVNVCSGNGAVYLVQSNGEKSKVIGRVADSAYPHKLAIRPGSLVIELTAPAPERKAVAEGSKEIVPMAGFDDLYLMHGRDLAGGLEAIDDFDVFEVAQKANVAAFYWLRPTDSGSRFVKIFEDDPSWWDVVSSRSSLKEIPSAGGEKTGLGGLRLLSGPWRFVADAFRPFDAEVRERAKAEASVGEWHWRPEYWDTEPYLTKKLETVAQTQRFIDMANKYGLTLELALDRYFPDPSLVRNKDFGAGVMDPVTGRVVAINVLDIANPKALEARLANLKKLLALVKGVRQTTLMTPLGVLEPHMARYYSFPLYSQAALASYRDFLNNPEARWPVEDTVPATPDNFNKPLENDWRQYFQWRKKAQTDYILAVARTAREACGGDKNYRGMSLRLPAAAYGDGVGLDMERLLTSPDIRLIVLTETWGKYDPDLALWQKVAAQTGKVILPFVELYKRQLSGAPQSADPTPGRLRDVLLSKLFTTDAPGGYLGGTEIMNPLFSGFGTFAVQGVGTSLWRPELEGIWQKYFESGYSNKPAVLMATRMVPFEKPAPPPKAGSAMPGGGPPGERPPGEMPPRGGEYGPQPGPVEPMELRETVVETPREAGSIDWLPYGVSIVVDGDLADWQGAGTRAGIDFLSGAKCRYSIYRRDAGSAALKGTASLLTDQKALYIAIEIADGRMPTARDSAAADNPFFSQDMLEIFIGFTDPAVNAPVPGYNALHLSLNPAAPPVGRRINIGRSRQATVLPGVDVAVSLPTVSRQSAIIEMAIPYTLFPDFKAAPGAAIAFDVAYANAERYGSWNQYFTWASPDAPWATLDRWGRLVYNQKQTRAGAGGGAPFRQPRGPGQY